MTRPFIALDSTRADLAGSWLSASTDDLSTPVTQRLESCGHGRALHRGGSSCCDDEFHITVTNTPRDADDLTYWLDGATAG